MSKKCDSSPYRSNTVKNKRNQYELLSKQNKWGRTSNNHGFQNIQDCPPSPGSTPLQNIQVKRKIVHLITRLFSQHITKH